MQPFVSVIVPVYNDPDGLAACLDSLAAQSYPKDRFEVIVADNGVRDHPRGAHGDVVDAARAKLPNARVVDCPKPGSYAARNVALALAAGEVIAFTDADCSPAPDWLARGVAALEADPALGVAAGYIELRNVEGGHNRLSYLYETTYSFPQGPEFAVKGSVATANWFSPVRAIREAGPFREDIKSTGDAEMARRIIAKGWGCAFVPDLVVGHPVRPYMRDLLAKRRRVVGGMWQREHGFKTARTALRVIRTAGSRVFKSLNLRKLSAPDRLMLSGAVLAVGAAELAELARLRLGGEPVR